MASRCLHSTLMKVHVVSKEWSYVTAVTGRFPLQCLRLSAFGSESLQYLSQSATGRSCRGTLPNSSMILCQWIGTLSASALRHDSRALPAGMLEIGLTSKQGSRVKKHAKDRTSWKCNCSRCSVVLLQFKNCQKHQIYALSRVKIKKVQQYLYPVASFRPRTCWRRHSGNPCPACSTSRYRWRTFQRKDTCSCRTGEERLTLM